MADSISSTSSLTTVNLVSTITPELISVGGKVTTTSLQIAEHFGKRHADVLRAIKNLECGPEFTERNFALSEFTDASGRKLPCYSISRDGFAFLAMGFTGKEAAYWKVAFLDAFNRMEQQLLVKGDAPMLRHDLAMNALSAANRVAADVQLAVFEGLAGGEPGWARSRWMVCFTRDRDEKLIPYVKKLEDGVVLFTLEHLAAALVEPGGMMPSNVELVNLAKACTDRLAQRLAYQASKLAVGKAAIA